MEYNIEPDIIGQGFFFRHHCSGNTSEKRIAKAGWKENDAGKNRGIRASKVSTPPRKDAMNYYQGITG
ncbi:MAG: hypothetical protein ACFFD4_37585 [Candidatus Odinarchaeota archaeon]